MNDILANNTSKGDLRAINSSSNSAATGTALEN